MGAFWPHSAVAVFSPKRLFCSECCSGLAGLFEKLSYEIAVKAKTGDVGSGLDDQA